MRRSMMIRNQLNTNFANIITLGWLVLLYNFKSQRRIEYERRHQCEAWKSDPDVQQVHENNYLTHYVHSHSGEQFASLLRANSNRQTAIAVESKTAK